MIHNNDKKNNMPSFLSVCQDRCISFKLLADFIKICHYVAHILIVCACAWHTLIRMRVMIDVLDFISLYPQDHFLGYCSLNQSVNNNNNEYPYATVGMSLLISVQILAMRSYNDYLVLFTCWLLSLSLLLLAQCFDSCTLHQVYAVPGNLQGISNWGHYLIYRGRLFSFHCLYLGDMPSVSYFIISQLLFTLFPLGQSPHCPIQRLNFQLLFYQIH